MKDGEAKCAACGAPEYLIGHGHPPLDRQFNVGERANPNGNGRPRGSSIQGALLRKLADGAPADGSREGELTEKVAACLLDLAINYDEKTASTALGAIRELLRRADGDVPKTIELGVDPREAALRNLRDMYDMLKPKGAPDRSLASDDKPANSTQHAQGDDDEDGPE